MPIAREMVHKIVSGYDLKNVTVGVLGSHSAEEVGVAAKAFGLPVVVVCQKGRDELYTKYNRHLFTYTIMLDNFADIVDEDVQERLLELNTVFIPNRSFSVYVGYDNIENRFKVPIYGNRFLLRAEERSESKNQYWLLERAGVKVPKRFSLPEEVDRLVIVKVHQKKKPLERAFFYASSPQEYYEESRYLIEQEIIDEAGLKSSKIEEFVLGPRFNANFQSWALKDVFDDFDFLGFDDRKQVNIGGILNLPARDQLSINVPIVNEEIGHYGLTMRESQKPLVYNAAFKFLRVCEKEYPPGIIGPFSLQGAIAYDPDDPQKKRLAFYIFDVSLRVPGCPCVGPTSPEMRRLTLKYREALRRCGVNEVEGALDLSMLEIRYSIDNDRLAEIVT